MCTVVLDFQPGLLTLLANRDERLDRPAQGWSLRTTPRGNRILAPRDITAGGTWIGINPHGLVAAITNHHTGQPPDPARLSRGTLVEDMLDHATTAQARRSVQAIHAQRHNPFHLMVVDAHAAFLWHSTPQGDALVDLPPGLHVATESDALGRGVRGDLIRTTYRVPFTPAQAHALLATHDPDPRHALCVHLGDVYGTRSSTLLTLGPTQRSLHVADQRPCITPWVDASNLLNTLFQG